METTQESNDTKASQRFNTSNKTLLKIPQYSCDRLSVPGELNCLSQSSPKIKELTDNDTSSSNTLFYRDTSEDQMKTTYSVSSPLSQTLTNVSLNPPNTEQSTSLNTNYILLNRNGNGHIMEDNCVEKTDRSNGISLEENNYTDSDSDEEEQDEYEVIIYDPLVFKPLPTQIAGHGSEGDGEKGFLKRPDGRLLKPVQAPPRGRRELDFYKRINSSKDPVDIRLKKCIPDFFGVEKVGFINGITVTEEFLILRDITEGFSRPAIMDIKIGSRTWGPDASVKKQLLEDAKYAGTKHPFGFSILGLITHSLRARSEENGEGCHGKKYSKSFGKNLKTDDVHTVPEIFFGANESDSRVAECVEIMTKQIRAIYEAFESQRKYIIYGSSLLMSYDASAVRRLQEGQIDKNELEKYVNVKLIDFAHVFPAHGERDDNFLKGLSNLLSLFEDFYKQLMPYPKV